MAAKLLLYFSFVLLAAQVNGKAYWMKITHLDGSPVEGMPDAETEVKDEPEIIKPAPKMQQQQQQDNQQQQQQKMMIEEEEQLKKRMNAIVHPHQHGARMMKVETVSVSWPCVAMGVNLLTFDAIILLMLIKKFVRYLKAKRAERAEKAGVDIVGPSTVRKVRLEEVKGSYVIDGNDSN